MRLPMGSTPGQDQRLAASSSRPTTCSRCRRDRSRRSIATLDSSGHSRRLEEARRDQPQIAPWPRLPARRLVAFHREKLPVDQLPPNGMFVVAPTSRATPGSAAIRSRAADEGRGPRQRQSPSWPHRAATPVIVAGCDRIEPRAGSPAAARSFRERRPAPISSIEAIAISATTSPRHARYQPGAQNGGARAVTQCCTC